MDPSYEVVAEGLRFPEGPVVMDDGSIILVEIERQTLTRVWDGKSEVIAELGGGPNGAAIGPDGAAYVCNNGGMEWFEINGLLLNGSAAEDYAGGWVERVDLSTGKSDRLYESIDGDQLSGPNDIVFDKAGGFYFTDLGKTYESKRTHDLGSLFYAQPDGSSIVELDHGHFAGNGVGLSPDEKTVYMADTYAGRLWAYELAAPGVVQPHRNGVMKGRIVAAMQDLEYFDSLAVTESGTVCVATILNGGVVAISPDGSFEHTAAPDPVITNICFGGADMQDAYLTSSGKGTILKCRWPEPGLPLNFTA